MIIPDQSHINRVRDALWQLPEGCASVMVGAGFCRNARKAGVDTRELPLWRDVAMLLCNRLYPHGDSDRLERAMTEASGTSGFLRLSQEYEAAFGRAALHSLIQELVPDDEYIPDEMHARLLRLPWRDVFTTNWDTLLERSQPLVADRAYGIVRTLEEIPLAPRPRIVKLHGSFPAHVPFIFTEEDYRTYPKRFAPFVNTVQQAMMETVFCLIGFSGDDPNFLYWSGWVRDNLGESAPKIYLAGWLDLSPHRRRMLEERNVVPIDLARHPQATSWPEHLRHRYATEWILYTLERGRPYDITEWPSPPDWHRSPVPKLLEPVEEVTVDAPVKEPSPPEGGVDITNLLEQIRALVRAWKQNRKAYPGWLAIPPSKHQLVGLGMHGWEVAILRAIPELTPTERLSAIRELVWRCENLLEPLSEPVEAAAQVILDEIDCQARKICGTAAPTAEWAGIREAWRDLAMALLTSARQRFDRDTFDRRLADLNPFRDDHPDVVQRIHHEKCLWALYALDFADLDKLLRQWHPEGCDTSWMTRKAAILIEADRNEEAIRLVNRSLSIVREAQRDGHTLASPSREGWTLWLALAFEHDFLRSTDEEVEAPPAFRRWQQLAALQCDAFVQKRDLLYALRGNPEKKDGPLFDLGARRGKTINFSNKEYERWISARRAVRLCEVAGLPPSASYMVVGSDILALAADHLKTTDHALACRLVLRLATSEDDATFNSIWARSRIAAMPMNEIATLVDLVNSVITYALPRVACAGTHPEFWVTRLRVAMEALSRLVLRLPPEHAQKLFKQGLGYYSMEGIAKHPWLSKTVGHLLSRSWEALPKSRRANLILDVLSSPIAGLDGFKTFDQYYSDPGELLVVHDETPKSARVLDTEGRWAEIINLLVRGLRAGGEARRRAAIRLMPLAIGKCFTDPEKKLVAQAVWHTSYTDTDTLPSGTSLSDWAFLLLPEPEPGIAERRFRGKWFSTQEPIDEKHLNEFFWHVGSAFTGLRHHQRPLPLTTEERMNLAATVEKWTKYPVSLDDDPMVRFGTSKAVTGLQSILPELDLPPSIAEALFDKAAALNQTNTPGFRLFAGLSKALPDRLDDIATSMRMGLASDKVVTVEEAILGLHTWLISASETMPQISEPPIDLLREIGMMIATRRKNTLNHALQVAHWIFSNGSGEQRNTITQSTLHGLQYLIEELRYDRDHSEDDELEIPLLRWGCAHLALAMSASGYDADPTVSHWKKVAQDDPLPEVRHAEGPTIKTHG